MICWETSRG